MKSIATAALAALLLTSPVFSDWQPGDPHKMHCPQLPDLTQTGIDIDLANGWLADDFMCTETGPILDIHIWGSFANDILPVNGIDWMCFHVSIHSDVPADDPTNPYGYSVPGELLWETDFCGPEHGPQNGFTWNLYAGDIDEWFWDPATGAVANDHECYQYNLYINEDEAFEQQEGTIYWLDVDAFAVCDDATFGWKTSLDHWNDDAVFYDDAGGPNAEPQELRYPDWHPFHPESIDMAFVITPEPATLTILAIGAVAFVRRRR